MTELDKPVVRRTQYKVRGNDAIVTMSPGGISMRRARSTEHYNVDFETLWRWLETAHVNIKPRSK